MDVNLKRTQYIVNMEIAYPYFVCVCVGAVYIKLGSKWHHIHALYKDRYITHTHTW